jgi:hypothetical protein
MKKALALALAALPLTTLAESPQHSDAPQHIDVSKLPSQSKIIDDVVVPVPSEIFGVLDKMARQDWASVQRPIKGVVQPIGEQPQIALLLGSVIAEGFVAVEAKDSKQVKQIGKSVLNLATALGVGSEVKARAQAITDAADKENDAGWNAVRMELDGALDDVKKAMGKLNSEALSQLVSLGGWIRGTEALTAVLDRSSYTKDGAGLLHQPVLLDYFDRRLSQLKPKYKANPVVIKVQKGLLDIRPLIGLAEGVDISSKSVQEINRITSGLIKSINSKAP